MTMYRRQFIPYRIWGYHVATVALRDAIVSPKHGVFAYVSDDGDLFQYDIETTAWVFITNNSIVSYPPGDSTKVGYLTVTAATDLDQIRLDTIANNAKNSYPSGDATKVGFITITQAVDLDTIESDTVLNNAKVTNATHTGEVTGSGALTVDKTAITSKSAVTADGADYVLISDASDSGNLKKALVSDFGGGSFDYSQVLFTQIFS